MGSYTIKDLEKISGIKAHTIRIWEKRYKLIEPQRTSTNIRTYCDAELKKLLNISILNRNGFKISKIAALSQNELTDSIQKLTENTSDLDSIIENLAVAMIDMDEAAFEKILSRSVIAMGFEDTLIKLIYPFLIRIGIMWQTGSIIPAQEHFITNLVRQKLLVAIDSQIISEKPGSKSFILFLPEGELHELGLLFYNYSLKKRGHKVIYLGPSVPLTDITDLCYKKTYDYLVTSFIASKPADEMIEYLKKLSAALPQKTILVSGKQFSEIQEPFPKNIKTFLTPEEFINSIHTLA